MDTKILSKSRRRFIRREKAQIRRKVFDLEEQERLISELYPKAHQAQIRLVGYGIQIQTMRGDIYGSEETG